MTTARPEPPPDAVARVDAFRAGHHADHEALHGGMVDELRRVNRRQGEMIAALRDENRRLREDHARLEQRAQDRPGSRR